MRSLAHLTLCGVIRRQLKSSDDEPDESGPARERDEDSGRREHHAEPTELADDRDGETERHHPPWQEAHETGGHRDAGHQQALRHRETGSAKNDCKVVEGLGEYGNLRDDGMSQDPDDSSRYGLVDGSHESAEESDMDAGDIAAQ